MELPFTGVGETVSSGKHMPSYAAPAGSIGGISGRGLGIHRQHGALIDRAFELK